MHGISNTNTKKILEKHKYSTSINLTLFFKQANSYKFKYKIIKIIKAKPDKKQIINESLTNIKNIEYKKFISKYIENQNEDTMKFNNINKL